MMLVQIAFSMLFAPVDASFENGPPTENVLKWGDFTSLFQAFLRPVGNVLCMLSDTQGVLLLRSLPIRLNDSHSRSSTQE
jgi:hypothetical protein